MRAAAEMRVLGTMLLLALGAAAAGAEVLDKSAAGFAVRTTVTLPLTPKAAFKRFSQPALWWADEHTFSGKAANLSLTTRPGGCFCERLPDGGFVQHLLVVYAAPGQLLRLQGGLGPLQSLGATGSYSVAFKAAANGSEVTATYVVTGYSATGLDKLAPAVDFVLAQQLTRFATINPAR